MTAEVVLHVCASCLPAERAEQVVMALQRALPSTARVAASDCLGPCDGPVALALDGEGRASYVFAGVSLPEDLDDLRATCRAYLHCPAGWIEDARPCGRLRFLLRARVPAARRPEA